MISQKEGIAPRLKESDIELITGFQAEYESLGLPKAFAKAIELRRAELSPIHLNGLTHRRGAVRTLAMTEAKESVLYPDEETDHCLLPYMVYKRAKQTWPSAPTVLRLHVVDLATGQALPASHVKVADVETYRTKAVEPFIDEQAKLLRSHLEQLVEVNLVEPLKH